VHEYAVFLRRKGAKKVCEVVAESSGYEVGWRVVSEEWGVRMAPIHTCRGAKSEWEGWSGVVNGWAVGDCGSKWWKELRRFSVVTRFGGVVERRGITRGR